MRQEMHEARRALSLTMERAAELAEIDKSYWSYIESGKKRPTLEVAARIAAVLHKDPTDLFEELRTGTRPA